MGKYFYLQCKRLVRSLPGALCVTLVLLLCLGLVFSGTMSAEASKEENQIFSVGIAGETDDFFFQMGLKALEAFDISRFSLELKSMTEDEAVAALKNGDVAAYLVIPDGFMDAAFSGQVIPIRFVSTTGSSTMVSVFKDEVSRMITMLLIASQKGVYGLHDALRANGQPISGHMDQLALEYVDYILMRDHVYSVHELGIADSLGLQEYLLCGLSVLLVWLSCMPFAPKLLRPDPALSQLLRSRGKSLSGQFLCDFGAYWLVLLPLCALPILGGLFMPELLQAPSWQLAATVLSFSLLCASMSFFLYQLSSQLLSGVLLQFFVTAAMCFVCGCMYPVYFFPETLQRLAAWLPAGIARSLLAGCVTGEATPRLFIVAAGYSCVFLILSRLVRHWDLKEASR